MAGLVPPRPGLPPGGRPPVGRDPTEGPKLRLPPGVSGMHSIRPLPIQPGGQPKNNYATTNVGVALRQGGEKKDEPGSPARSGAPGKLDPSKFAGLPASPSPMPGLNRPSSFSPTVATPAFTTESARVGSPRGPTPELRKMGSVMMSKDDTCSQPSDLRPLKHPASTNPNPRPSLPSMALPPAAAESDTHPRGSDGHRTDAVRSNEAGHVRAASDFVVSGPLKVRPTNADAKASMMKLPKFDKGPPTGRVPSATLPNQFKITSTSTPNLLPTPERVEREAPTENGTGSHAPSAYSSPPSSYGPPSSHGTSASDRPFSAPPPSLKPVLSKMPTLAANRLQPTDVVLEPPRRMTKFIASSAQSPRPQPPVARTNAPPAIAPRPKDDSSETNETPGQKRERMRKKVSVELMETEQSYVESLKLLDSAYFVPLKAAVNTPQVVLPMTDIYTLFSNISQIQELNNKFLADLQKRIDGWTETTCVCDLVKDFAPYFKMYTQYVSNYATASDLLVKLQSNQVFTTFSDSVIAKGNKDLAFYLIMPIQRIPRYKLLLQEIQKVTDATHPDKKACDEALEVVSQVALHINNSVKAHESRQKIMEIQSNFAGSVDFVSPSRRFIRQGQLTKVCRATTKLYTFFCFNDLLVYADVKLVTLGAAGVKRFKLHRQIPIDGSFGIQDMSDDAKFPHRFTIINAQKSFVVCAPSKEEKAQWFKDLATCMNEFRHMTKTKNAPEPVTAGHIAPVWQTDSSAKECQCCGTTFSLVRRRHHCRYCGSLVCEACSTKRMKVSTKKEALRVCDMCVARIKGDAPPNKKNVPEAAPDGKGDGSKPGEFNDVESDEDVPAEAQDGVKAVALHTFEATLATDLGFQQGDTIWVTNQKDPGWWEGTMNGKTGVFPANYVAIDGVGPAVESVPMDQRMVCRTAYGAQNSTELTIVPGDHIQCTARENVVGGQDGTEEWLYGTNARTGHEGWFPATSVTSG